MSKIVYCWYCDQRLEFEKIKDNKIYLICPKCKLRVYVIEEKDENEQSSK
jgi:uncharacterized protein YbaR (Trm112 family)